MADIFDRAFEIHAATLAAFGVADTPAHRWRVGTSTWDELREAAWKVSRIAVPTRAPEPRLLGWPVVIDEDVRPDLMRLERLDG